MEKFKFFIFMRAEKQKDIIYQTRCKKILRLDGLKTRVERYKISPLVKHYFMKLDEEVIKVV